MKKLTLIQRYNSNLTSFNSESNTKSIHVNYKNFLGEKKNPRFTILTDKDSLIINSEN